MGNCVKERIGKVPLHNGFEQDEFWVWGSSVVKGDDGLYHMYVSRWNKKYPFHPGWITDSEIVHAVSSTAVGPYKFSDVALGKRGAQYWDGKSCHNPKILRYKDKYILFYMGSTHPLGELHADGDNSSPQCTVGRSNKRIGIAVSDNPYGPWRRFDQPALPTKPNSFYSFLTSNPAPLIHNDGSVLLMFKSRAYNGDVQGPMSIGIARADNYLGPYTVISAKPLFEEVGEIEDPSIWFDSTGYHVLAKEMHGTISGEKGAGLLFHSNDGLDWQMDESPVAYSRSIEWEDGCRMTLGHMERVFPLVEDNVITTLFFAVKDGRQGFASVGKSWNMAIPMRS